MYFYVALVKLRTLSACQTLAYANYKLDFITSFEFKILIKALSLLFMSSAPISHVTFNQRVTGLFIRFFMIVSDKTSNLKNNLIMN